VAGAGTAHEDLVIKQPLFATGAFSKRFENAPKLFLPCDGTAKIAVTMAISVHDVFFSFGFVYVHLWLEIYG
jgi:hypothetical protein